MQKTNFEFEVIIADDASTDNTQEIIKEYTSKYPKIFKSTLRKKNIGAIENSVDALRRAKGKYIALCEGDDYWTSSNKLQIQADFLDSHQDHALCFHPVKIAYEDNSITDEIFPDRTNGFSAKELLRSNFVQTNSVMYRKQDYTQIPTGILPLDWYLHLYHAQFGKIGFINNVMSVYRRHSAGLWWDSHSDIEQHWKKNGLSYLALHSEFLKLFKSNEQYRAIIFESSSRVYDAFTGLGMKNDIELLQKAASGFDELTAQYIIRQQKILHETNDVLNAHRDELKKNQELVAAKEAHIQVIEKELKRIESSSIWKIAYKIKNNKPK
jgi:glycosyltransferase involved in cell wall biosynthesis